MKKSELHSTNELAFFLILNNFILKDNLSKQRFPDILNIAMNGWCQHLMIII